MTTPAIDRPSATDLALSFSNDIAGIIDASGARVESVTLSENRVIILCDSPSDVDLIADVFDASPNGSRLDSTMFGKYWRHLVFDEAVKVVASAPLPPKCSCGVRCDHQAVTA